METVRSSFPAMKFLHILFDPMQIAGPTKLGVFIGFEAVFRVSKRTSSSCFTLLPTS